MAGLEFEVPKELETKQVEAIERASKNGKIRIGVNETTKAIERGIAKIVFVASDVSPKEIVMHLPLICKEKNIPFSFIKTKEDLGKAVGIPVSTSSIAITDEGDAKKEIADIIKKVSDLQK